MGTFLWLFERRLAVAYSSAGPHAFDRTPKALNGKPATIDKIQRAADCFRCFFAPLLLRAHSDRESVRQFRSNPLGSVWSPGRLGPVPLWRCVSRLRLPVDMEPEDNASLAPRSSTREQGFPGKLQRCISNTPGHSEDPDYVADFHVDWFHNISDAGAPSAFTRLFLHLLCRLSFVSFVLLCLSLLFWYNLAFLSKAVRASTRWCPSSLEVSEDSCGNGVALPSVFFFLCAIVWFLFLVFTSRTYAMID